MFAARQLSFDDAPPPLHSVTFVVFDLETTGPSAGADRVTEIGAVKVRGGEVLGTFATLVDPGDGVHIPPTITILTGITDAMVHNAPELDAVLPSFLEWAGPDAVLVGHNVRFDLSFVKAACRALGYEQPANAVVDTCSLARRLLRQEVPNCRLSTLADRLRLPHRPTHRALDDAWATVDLLHVLLERAGCLGVTFLDDLLELPTAAGHPQGQKLKWVASLPRRPGIYIFRDSGGRPLYVGKAVDLRRRVRQYFGHDDRRKVPQLVREAAAVDHVVCAHELEAVALEVRMIHELEPRFNRQVTRWRGYAYVRLDLSERWPRLSVVRRPKLGKDVVHLGPVASVRTAKAIAEAVQDAVPLRRCAERIGRDGPTGGWRAAPCGPAQLGVAYCPCAGDVDGDTYRSVANLVATALTADPAPLVEPLTRRMHRFAADQRFEEAAAVRDRIDLLGRAVARQQRLGALRAAGRVTVRLAGGGGATLDRGLLVAAWPGTDRPLLLELTGPEAPIVDPSSLPPLPVHEVDEVAAISSWLETNRATITLEAD